MDQSSPWETLGWGKGGRSRLGHVFSWCSGGNPTSVRILDHLPLSESQGTRVRVGCVRVVPGGAGNQLPTRVLWKCGTGRSDRDLVGSRVGRGRRLKGRFTGPRRDVGPGESTRLPVLPRWVG